MFSSIEDIFKNGGKIPDDKKESVERMYLLLCRVTSDSHEEFLKNGKDPASMLLLMEYIADLLNEFVHETCKNIEYEK